MGELSSWFTCEEDGQGMVEYGLVLVLVSIVLVAGLTAMGASLENIFQGIANDIAGVMP